MGRITFSWLILMVAVGLASGVLSYHLILELPSCRGGLAVVVETPYRIRFVTRLNLRMNRALGMYYSLETS